MEANEALVNPPRLMYPPLKGIIIKLSMNEVPKISAKCLMFFLCIILIYLLALHIPLQLNPINNSHPKLDGEQVIFPQDHDVIPVVPPVA